jgi:hypothetical protein
MTHGESVFVVTMLVLGGALASAVAEAQPIPMPNPRTAVAYAACQKEADAAFPRLNTTQDQMNHYLRFGACMEKRGYPLPNYAHRRR